MKIEYIYTLYFELEGQKEYFYVGRTNDPTVRLSGHRSSLKCGDQTLKYHFLRTVVEPGGFEWGMEVIKEIPVNDYPLDYEDYYVIKYIREGYVLTNMKHGDLEKRKVLEALIDDKKIRSVQDVKLEREQREKRVNDTKYAKSEALRLKVLADAEAKDDTDRLLDSIKQHRAWAFVFKDALKQKGWKAVKKGSKVQTKTVQGYDILRGRLEDGRCSVGTMKDGQLVEFVRDNYGLCYDVFLRTCDRWK